MVAIPFSVIQHTISFFKPIPIRQTHIQYSYYIQISKEPTSEHSVYQLNCLSITALIIPKNLENFMAFVKLLYTTSGPGTL